METSAMCVCNATRFKFNLNEHIRFKPTELGKTIFKEYWIPYCQDGKSEEIETNDEGWAEIQLWVFMRIFGSHFSGGAGLPVETGVILIDTVKEQLQVLQKGGVK